ncbi:MAG: hypothetical protein HZA90_19220 [Verrucomicrobia bacterium]|nr:hypothetical protein [Verrucomicrobiota bacterium]
MLAKIAWLAWPFLSVPDVRSVDAASAPSTNAPTVLLVLGAAGESEFGSNFVHQAQLWEKACRQAGADFTKIGLSPSNAPNDHDLLKQHLAAVTPDGLASLWLVLVGHGTFDGKEARFNLRGPDLSATELAEWFKPLQRPVVVINTAASSAPFLNKLSATNRTVITATRSGSEQNFARFGQYLAQCIADPKSDLDQDGQTSLLEAFLSASAHVAEFYKTEGRIATEHALLDDNGDGKGTPADWFRGVRAIKKPQHGTLDGARAQQIHLVLSAGEQALPPDVRAKRDALELEVIRLREAKQTLAEDEYYRKLEALLLDLARLQVTNHPAVTNHQRRKVSTGTMPLGAR